MKTVSIFVLLTITASFGSDFSIVVSDNVSGFIEKHKNAKTNVFRSGHINSNKDMNSFATFSSDDSLSIGNEYNVDEQNNKWRNGNIEEYSIQNNDQSGKYKSFLNRKVGTDHFNVRFDSIQKEYHVVPKIGSKHSQIYNAQQLLKIADSLFQEDLPSLKVHTEYDVYAANFTNDTLCGITACYRRIFNHGIVRNNASSVNIQIDASGNLIEYFFTWPKFVLIDDKVNKTTVKLTNDIIGMLSSELINYSEIDSEAVLFPLLKATVTGVSFGWYQSDFNNIKILTPCYSFSTLLNYSNGQQIGHTISIPVLKKYYPN